MNRVASCWLLLLVTSCGGEAAPPPPPPSAAAITPVGAAIGAPITATIGPEGGALASADGRLALTVPAGGLAAATAISVTPIENQGPGGLGTGYRLGPDGLTFAHPVTLTFTYTDEDVAGSAPELLRVAYQDADRTWLPIAVTVQAGDKRVVAQSTHFTDFGLMLGARITPGSTSVKVSQTAALSVVSCPILELGAKGPALAGCDPVTVSPSAWAVNGVAGGSGTTGTVGGQGTGATYKAPAKPPSPPTVQVSTELTTAGGGKTILFANVRVLPEDGPGQWGGEATYTPVLDPRPDAVQWRAEASFHFEIQTSGGGSPGALKGIVTLTRITPAPPGAHDCTVTVVPDSLALDITAENTTGFVEIFKDLSLSTYFGSAATGFPIATTLHCPNQPPYTTMDSDLVTWLVIPMTPWDGSGGIEGTLTDPDGGGTWVWNLFQQTGQ